MLDGIVRLQLDRIVKRVDAHHGIVVRYQDDVVEHIVARCTEVASGGRMIDAILTNTMLPEMSIALLERQVEGDEITAITVRVDGDGLAYRFATAQEPGAREGAPDATIGAADGAVEP